MAERVPAFLGAELLEAFAKERPQRVMVRLRAVRTMALSLAKQRSIALRSGLEGGRYQSETPARSIARRTPATFRALRLSPMTMSPACSAVTRICSALARKPGPSIAPQQIRGDARFVEKNQVRRVPRRRVTSRGPSRRPRPPSCRHRCRGGPVPASPSSRRASTPPACARRSTTIGPFGTRAS